MLVQAHFCITYTTRRRTELIVKLEKQFPFRTPINFSDHNKIFNLIYERGTFSHSRKQINCGRLFAVFVSFTQKPGFKKECQTTHRAACFYIVKTGKNGTGDPTEN